MKELNNIIAKAQVLGYKIINKSSWFTVLEDVTPRQHGMFDLKPDTFRIYIDCSGEIMKNEVVSNIYGNENFLIIRYYKPSDYGMLKSYMRVFVKGRQQPVLPNTNGTVIGMPELTGDCVLFKSNISYYVIHKSGKNMKIDKGKWILSNIREYRLGDINGYGIYTSTDIDKPIYVIDSKFSRLYIYNQTESNYSILKQLPIREGGVEHHP